jgi:hypothetical protein
MRSDFKPLAWRFRKTPHEKTVLDAQIARADRRIDALVNELYGLTADEIKIVEEGAT